MYLFVLIIAVLALCFIDIRIGILIAIIVFVIDRVMDMYRRELDSKINDLYEMIEKENK